MPATPTQIKEGLASLTQKGQALQAPAQSITVVNAHLVVVGQGPFPIIISGYTDIVSVANVLISELEGSSPLSGPDSDLILASYKELARVHMTLLNILIGKGGALSTSPFVGQPVSTVLRQVEGVIDTISISLIQLAVDKSDALSGEANSLGNSLELAISTYEGIAGGL